MRSSEHGKLAGKQVTTRSRRPRHPNALGTLTPRHAFHVNIKLLRLYLLRSARVARDGFRPQ